jgi:hypothetical protein
MNSFLNGLSKFFSALIEVFRLLPRLFPQLLPFLRGLCRALHRGFRKPDRGGCCLTLPPSVHLRADPMLYAQYWLMSQGLAVTWDNPDIQIYDAGSNKPVPPDSLQLDHDYQVEVRVWNGSYSAPAVGLGIDLSYIHIGFGNAQTPIGKNTANLGVKGSTHCPAFARIPWHTPPVKGHYCLLALLVWPDDANSGNNLGQKNTLVGETHSPAQFTFTVTNDAAVLRRYELEPDMYRLPFVKPCRDTVPPPRGRRDLAAGRYVESQARWAAALQTQAYGKFPVTGDWNLTISPRAFSLAPGISQEINVSADYLRGTFIGTQPFNIHGFATPPNGPRKLVGGVTLYAHGS